MPVIAVTSIFNLDKRPTAIDPTPPVAPDTTTGNSIASVFEITASTLAAAVIPAVPNEIALPLINYPATEQPSLMEHE